MLGLKVQTKTGRMRSAILGVESTASGNVVLRVGREAGANVAEQTEHVVLTRDEAHDLVFLVETALEGGS